MKLFRIVALSSVSLLSVSGAAHAQTAPAPTATDDSNKAAEIVVTGTLIHGTVAVGSQTITVDSKAILAQAATSTNELLSVVPQIANSFNGRIEGDPRGVTSGLSINRPNLRNFPSSNTTSGALTLVLVDGMRIAPVGVNQSSPDVDIIPAAVLAGIDIVTDGGSSLYGADAVAGVLNFRTMKKFDGIKVDGNFGFGTTIGGFHEWDGAVTAGHSWTGGNAYISVGHSDRNVILNGQVPWSSGKVYNAAGTGSYVSTQCNSPVGSVVNYFYYGAGYTNNAAAPGAGRFPVGTACDQISAQTYLPGQKRTNVFGALSQELSDNVDLRVTAYYTKRDSTLPGYPVGYATVDSAFVAPAVPPAFGTIISTQGGTGFALGPNAAYVNKPFLVGFQTYGVTPELNVKFGGNWHLRTTASIGRSTNYQRMPGVNGPLTQSYINSGQLNPLNVAAASAAVINDITNFETAQDTTHDLFDMRAVVDGPLFMLPGGQAKVAVGVEYQYNKDATRVIAGPNGSVSSLPYNSAHRNAKSAFGEITLPVAPFADVSGSVRYDKYSDFGSTTNPTVGLTLKPVSWLKIYGHYDTSYNAPTPLDSLGIGLGRAGVNFSATSRPQVATGKSDNGQGTYFLVLTGGSPLGLKPQTSSSWAVGFDAKPVAHLSFGAEFYSINLKNAIGALNPGNASTYQTNPGSYYYNNELTANNNALYNTILSQLANGAAIAAQIAGGASNLAVLVDSRTSNLNAAKVEGVDFHMNYDITTDMGNFSAGVNGTNATRARITNSGATTNELGHALPRFTASTFVGFGQGPFSGRMTVNYSGGFHDGAFDYLGVDEDVGAFVVANLSLGYTFADTHGALSGASFRLNVDNLMDNQPQTIKRANTNNPSYNNWTLGRVIKLGFTEKF